MESVFTAFVEYFSASISRFRKKIAVGIIFFLPLFCVFGGFSQKYKQVSIEIALRRPASLYHQNSTGKQTKFTFTIKTTRIMKKPIVTNNNAKRVSLTEQQLNAVKGGMQYRAKRAELPTN